MEKLTASFTISALADFFKNAISSFKNEEEDLNHIFEGKEFPEFSDLTKIGSVEFKNTDELIVFACKYKGLLTERSSKKKQFEIAKLVLKDDFKDGAIFVFYDEEGKFRFSFIKRNWDGKGEQKYSVWKRFTYFVDPKQTNKTFKNRIGNCTFKNLESIQEAFSVEKLTKEFYNDLFKWYQWVLSEEIGITYPNNTDTSDDDRVKLEEQVIRLITRLLFVWFIKQKHLVPDELFKTEELSKVLKDFDPDSKTDGNYYNAILQNLFFATLNKAINERDFAKLKTRDIKTLYRYAEMFEISEDEILELFRPIPFLNGGLFECLDKEDVDGNKYFLDGYSRNDKRAANGNLKHRAFIPNCVFFDEKNGIIPLLERYNFTVEENAPNEVQVALDPELLGNVFENLLGAFNDETKETARKQSGSFYTPREIVSYMVDESLIAYLINTLPNIAENIIRQLFEEEELPIELANNHALCEEIASKLRVIKILDPACGSGAFPMGILNRMVEILDRLDARDEKTIYDQKLHLIEECIYGIDLQTIATQISKLRFFISLIVEQDGMDLSKPDENYKVITLPNLETKFVAANTLIGIKRKPAQGNLFENPEIETTKQELLAIRKEHFYAKTANRKKTLREKDAELREKLSQLLQEDNEFAPEDAVQFSKWNPYDQNSSSPFFDPEWMFGLSKENGGLSSTDMGYFDIVIGNPPYIDIKSLAKKDVDYYFSNFETPQNRINIYAVFIEKSIQILKFTGVLSFIIPNSLLINSSYEKTRRYIGNKVDCILKLPDGIFENAIVETIIIKVRNNKLENTVRAKVFPNKSFISLNNIEYSKYSVKEWKNDQEFRFNIFQSKESVDILLKIEKKSKYNLDGIADFSLGITPYDKYKGHSENMIRNKVFHSKKQLDHTYKPLISGKNIKRYVVDEKTDEYIKYGNWLGAPREERFFISPRLIVRQIIANNPMRIFCAYTEQPLYFTQIGFSIITRNEFYPNFVLLALLNSELLNFYHTHRFLDTEKNVFQKILIANCKKIPIPFISDKVLNQLELLVKSVIKSINEEQEINTIENEINSLVYKLYDLSYNDIKVINSDFSLSAQDYNAIEV